MNNHNTYIHEWPFSQDYGLVSYTTHVRSGTYSLMSTSNDRFLKNFAGLFFPSLRGNCRRNIFFLFRFDAWSWDTKPVFSSNKPAHYGHFNHNTIQISLECYRVSSNIIRCNKNLSCSSIIIFTIMLISHTDMVFEPRSVCGRNIASRKSDCLAYNMIRVERSHLPVFLRKWLPTNL